MQSYIEINTVKYNVLSLSGVEEISCPYSFSIRVSISNVDYINNMLGKNAILYLCDFGKINHYPGFISSIQLEELLYDGQILVSVKFYSKFKKLDYSGGIKILQNMSVIECVKSVLERNNFNFSLKNFCKNIYQQQDLWQQLAGETDLEFINRILYEHGIYWCSITDNDLNASRDKERYNENNSKEYIALYDNSINQSKYINPKIINVYSDYSSETQDPNFIGGFDVFGEDILHANNIKAKDCSKNCPVDYIVESYTLDSPIKYLSQNSYVGFGLSDQELNKKAKFLGEEALNESKNIKLTTNLSYLRAGKKTALNIVDKNKFSQILDSESFFITKIIHSYKSSDNLEGGVIYTNNIRLIPSSIPFRNKVKHIQNINQNLLAKIDSIPFADTNHAYIDGDGLYKTQILDFLENSPPGFCSNWISKLQPYTGKYDNYATKTGWHMPLLSCTETLVGFLNNNPNQPFILGALANKENKNLVNKNNNNQSIWRSASYNELLVDDHSIKFKISTNNYYNYIEMNGLEEKFYFDDDINSTNVKKCKNNISFYSKFGDINSKASLHLNISTNSNKEEIILEDKKEYASNNFLLNVSGDINFKVKNNYNILCEQEIKFLSQKNTHITCGEQININSKNNIIETSTSDIIIKSSSDNINICADSEINIKGAGNDDIFIGLDDINTSGIKITKAGEVIIFGKHIRLQAENISISSQVDKLLVEPFLPINESLNLMKIESPAEFNLYGFKPDKDILKSTRYLFNDEFEYGNTLDFECINKINFCSFLDSVKYDATLSSDDVDLNNVTQNKDTEVIV